MFIAGTLHKLGERFQLVIFGVGELTSTRVNLWATRPVTVTETMMMPPAMRNTEPNVAA